MNREDVLDIVKSAREDNKLPDLSGADLRDANLRCADLRGANLSGADLYGASLSDANLSDARWGGLEINRLPSGPLQLIPTHQGWHIQLGCWYGTPEQLRELIAQDQGWPEAEGDEITRRRPYIEAALALCDIHMQDHEDIIPTLAEKWTDKENNQ